MYKMNKIGYGSVDDFDTFNRINDATDATYYEFNK